MTTPVRVLADTSIFIAAESGRPLAPLPYLLSVSVVTLGELEFGVNAADDQATRARRARTLGTARRADPLPVTESVMSVWSRLVDACRRAGATAAVKRLDSIIAATAVDLGLPVVTRDSDYDRIAESFPALVVVRV